jgi:hypothetical protein
VFILRFRVEHDLGNGRTVCGDACSWVGLGTKIALVRVSDGTRTVAQAKQLTTPYRFSFVVPPGTYKVEASGDRSVNVTVIRGRTSSLKLVSGCK